MTVVEIFTVTALRRAGIAPKLRIGQRSPKAITRDLERVIDLGSR
jgi:hypothetical protein